MRCRCREWGGNWIGRAEARDSPENYAVLVVTLRKNEVVEERNAKLY